ncbi:MIF4G domain-containing protein B isoform X1 [Heterodontus francisci]|uniref:MIF4G domain-containing protein B isoform X1 n=1 Tax=Heterodontus francisci TaxID=7792 RepID=UPI00355C7B89
MENLAKDDYKIQSFDADTQQLLKTALKEPASVDLELVASVIVEQSMKDLVFSKEAGRICYTIVQAENKQSGNCNFRRNILIRLQQEFLVKEQVRERSVNDWVCLVTFICNIFDYLKVNNMPMMALVNPVYDCLFRLAQPDSLQNEEEVRKETGSNPLDHRIRGRLQVDCLVLQLHRIGEQLQRMNTQRMDDLFCQLRDGFLLQHQPSSLSRLLLLEIIEFRAGGWKMSENAQKYYYSEVAD